LARPPSGLSTSNDIDPLAIEIANTYATASMRDVGVSD
jgi:hypothetical protein